MLFFNLQIRSCSNLQSQETAQESAVNVRLARYAPFAVCCWPVLERLMQSGTLQVGRGARAAAAQV